MLYRINSNSCKADAHGTCQMLLLQTEQLQEASLAPAGTDLSGQVDALLVQKVCCSLL